MAKCAHLWRVVGTRKLNDGRIEERMQCDKCGSKAVDTRKG